MNHQVIEELTSGDVSLRIVQLEDDSLIRKYWLKAGAGHLEFDEDGVDDLMDVLDELHSRPGSFLGDSLFLLIAAPLFYMSLSFIVGVIFTTWIIA